MLELVKIKDLYDRDVEYALNRSIFFKYENLSSFYIYSIFENESLLFPVNEETYNTEFSKVDNNPEFIVKDFDELYNTLFTAKYISTVETLPVGELLDLNSVEVPDYLLKNIISEN